MRALVAQDDRAGCRRSGRRSPPASMTCGAGTPSLAINPATALKLGILFPTAASREDRAEQDPAEDGHDPLKRARHGRSPWNLQARSNSNTSDGSSARIDRCDSVADGGTVAGREGEPIQARRRPSTLAARRGGRTATDASPRWPSSRAARKSRASWRMISEPSRPSGEATSRSRLCRSSVGERLLLVGRLQSLPFGQQPDLVEVDRLDRRGVELAVRDAGPGGHPLQFAGRSTPPVPRLSRCASAPSRT